MSADSGKAAAVAPQVGIIIPTRVPESIVEGVPA
jgi:hypothetical protein